MSILEAVKKINSARFINILLTVCLTLFLIFAAIGGLTLIKMSRDRNKPFLTASAIYGPKVELIPEILPVVASKNGAKYYLESCGAVGRIKPENLIRFISRQEAEKKGYAAAQNCVELTDYISE